MKTLKDFYEERKRIALLFPPMVYGFSKPKYREPLDKEHQETLNIYVKQIYNPRLRKLKEAEHFREEFMEPQAEGARLQA